MSYTRQHLRRSRADHRRRSTPTRSSAWPTSLADVRDARRPAVLPRRRRQRRQLLARGQRLPQARRLRGLRADRQRLRADRAHQRRRLGHGVRRLAAGQPAARAKTRVFVFSVGGGSLEKNISPNLVRALQYASEVGATIVGVVGRDGGYTAQVADACVIVPTVNPETRHAARRGVPGGGLAPARLAPAAQGGADQVGIDRGDAGRAVFLDRDGVLNRAVVRDGKPYPPDRVDELEMLPGVPRGARAAQGGRLRARRRHQPARRRARHADARGRRRDPRAAARRSCRSTSFASAATTTPTAASAASRSPGLLDAAAATYDLAAQRHGRRPLARHRGRAGAPAAGRDPHRLRLR